MKTIHSNIAHSMIKPCARMGFENRLSNLFIRTIATRIAQPIKLINDIFIRSNCLPVRSKFLLIRSNG